VTCPANTVRDVLGLIQAASGAIGGMLADQWKDFYTIPTGLPGTAAVFAAVPQGTNAGRGSNTKGSSNIITNGSKIVVPEGYGLLLFQDGRITGFAAEAGGYIWQSDDPNSKSIFAGDPVTAALITQSWERFKFGGQPGSQQAAYFVSLKELPDNRFGTQSEIYWDDARLLHAEDRRPDPVREGLRAGVVPAGRPGVRLHRHGQCRGRAALQ
jgi:membrane protease subunit (stomatin/prohibitin family)